MDRRHLSVNDFKNWLSEQKTDSDFFVGSRPEDPNQKYIGKSVCSKVSSKKLLEKIETEGNDKEELVCEFKTTGGTVSKVEPKRVLIQTESGEFYLPRFCVKILKD